MDQARSELDRMRRDPAAWPELGYEQGEDADGHAFDRNMVARARVLWALQYDRRPNDLPLLRWLLSQEAVCRRESPFQGLSDETQLASYLLARHRQVEDVWLHYETKLANFDTWCGYDVQHLVAGGVPATIEAVRASAHPDRDNVLERLLDGEGAPTVTDDHVESWFAGQAARFPEDPAEEDELTWVRRAHLVGDRDAGRRHLLRWADGRERDERMLSRLRHEWEALGDTAEAARVQREALNLITTPFSKAGAWRKLAELERLSGDLPAAWAALRSCADGLDGIPDWQEVGLGRSYVEELFRLAAAADEHLAGTVFAVADRVAPTVPRLPLVTLEAASEAALRVGDDPRFDHYQRLWDEERRRIDEELGR